MKHVVNAIRTEIENQKPYLLAKDWWGGRMVGLEWQKAGQKAPFWTGTAYSVHEYQAVVYYPIPLNFLVRWSRCASMLMLRAVYWIGLIDVGPGERVTWQEFWRIKSKRSNIW